MNEYLNIISLAQAKLYLKVDELQTVTDDEIMAMIAGSLSFVEKQTCHIMYPREKNYYSLTGYDTVNVYDYPIDNTTNPLVITYKPGYAIVPTIDGMVTLTVGYADATAIPPELIEAALQILKVWYYESETQTNSTLLPLSVKQALETNKRFV